MEKSRGLFAEDFGPFMRPGSDALGFSSKLETISEQFKEKLGLNGHSSRCLGPESQIGMGSLKMFSLKCDVCFN